MAKKIVELPEIGLVTLYKRRGSRSLRLSISSTGEVRVSLPYWLPYKAAEQFARAKAGWITDNRPTGERPLRSGQQIGKEHRLHFVTTVGHKRPTTRTAGANIIVRLPFGLGAEEEAAQTIAQKACIRALKNEAEARLPGRLRRLAADYGYDFRSVSVKQLKSRWGSCDARQNIVLNLFLMQLPWQLIDYVLLHELVHTEVLRHGPPFWQAMTRHLPSARELRREIGRYQPVLTPASPSDIEAWHNEAVWPADS